MRNYAEELAFWFLRLNGFFPISDFVIHRTRPAYSSDCDLLAVRPPHVHEPVGGNWNDWDCYLRSHFDSHRMIGVICEVKAGEYNQTSILEDENVHYALGRLGFIPEEETAAKVQQLKTLKHMDISQSYRVVKLLIANKKPTDDRHFYYLSISYVRNFIKQRMQNYPVKGSDWTFFQSSIIQEIIWETRSL